MCCAYNLCLVHFPPCIFVIASELLKYSLQLTFVLNLIQEILMELYFKLGFPGGSDIKESSCSAKHLGSTSGSGRSPGEGKATHSSILAWRIPWTEESGGLQSFGVTKSQTQLSD